MEINSTTEKRLSNCGNDDGLLTTPIIITTPVLHMNGSTTTGGVNLASTTTTTSTPANNNINGSNTNSSGGVGLIGGGGNANNSNRLASRRPQIQISPSIEQKIFLPPQLLSLTIHKDANGYGMKVSGDNPVFVESVKAGGAAQKAGLVAGDMILKVNGTEVRSEKHTTVVSLIKSHTIVDLTVKRSQKMQRPSSVGITNPSTPILSRERTASITYPQPVDSVKRRELEFSKIKTLQLMLEQEKKNLEALKGNTNNPSYKRSETNMRKLQEQLRQVGGEDPATLQYLATSATSPANLLSPITTPTGTHLNPSLTATTPQAQQFSPAFLSLLPRSLSSLSLGTRKKTESTSNVTSPLSNSNTPTDFLSTNSPLSHSMSQSVHSRPSPQQTGSYNTPHGLPNATPVKKKFSSSQKNLREDIPPPLPQRNPPRNLQLETNNASSRGNVPVSDLDHSMGSSIPSPKRNTPSPSSSQLKGSAASASASSKKRPKSKTKALSDPKMSTQMFLQMEKCGSGEGDDICTPPPLPPRQPGMMEEAQNILNSNKNLSKAAVANVSGGGNTVNNSANTRPTPNSIETLMNYPLVSTCTAVRDNMSAAFPFSQRPNIVQQLQQHQQNLHHHHHHHNLPQPPSHNSSSKSTALGQTPPLNHFNKHRRVVSSPENIHPRHERHLDRHNKSTSGSWDLAEKDNEITPPGTPPPPYPSSQNMSQSQIIHGSEEPDHMFMDTSTGSPMMPHATFPNQISAAQATSIQKGIISMEDEEISDQECVVDEHGPFNYLQRLLENENIAHLAVFLNYVLSNSDPAPLLFYLITGLYKEGTVKDMRKWAYEIHSTFLVPCAPLMWFRADESLAREVDNVLQNEYDKVEILRKVFWKSRKKAKERICDQLREFQQKRTAGLGTIYGPCDSQLADAKGDKVKEQKIFEETLLPKLQQLLDELEASVEEPKKLALCSALSTVLHRIFITRSNPPSLIDRVHHFVSREKSFKSRIMGKNRKMVVRGHPLVLRQYYEVTHCNHCQTIIWGVSPQGYHCTDCKLNIHRPCSKVLEESCPGPVPQKRKEQHTDKISKFMGKIRPSHNFIQNERRSRQDEESGNIDDLFTSERLHSTSIVRQPSDRRPDVANTSISSSGNTSHNTSELQTSQSLDAETSALDAEKETKRDRSKSKSAPVSVNRSESYKERLSHKRNRTNRRKTSDPSLSSKANDEQSELGLSNANYTASSSSSLSSGGSLEGSNTSLEPVGGTGMVASAHAQAHPITMLGSSTGGIGTGPMITAQGTIPAPRQWVDSEDEDDIAEVDWSSNVAAEVLAALTDAEKKRQEIINEIYQTERSHVRTLKLLEGIFMRPLQESCVLPYDHLQLLFPPALLSLKDLHSSFEQKLKIRRIAHNHLVQNVGDLLVGMFEGQTGEELREFAAQFCARQQIALEALKEKRRKDENLQRFLTKAESHKACRRLQLKDLLPTVLQRLTKYPLLFENLYKLTKRVLPDDNTEADAIQRALDSSKRILVDVNQAVKTAEDAHKLQTIQRKLDKSSFDKDATNEFKHLDLTQLKLIHDGHLTMKKNPGVQLHGLLFENMMVLLHKQDDKYFLKNFPNLAAGDADKNKSISPITHFDQQTLVRQSAVDKNTFFLIITKTSQMLELRAPSSSECKTWFKHISDAAEQYKPRSKNSHDVVEDPASATLPHSNTKESLESTPERTSSSVGNNNAVPSGGDNQTSTTNNVDNAATAEKNRNHLTNNNNSSIDGGVVAGGRRESTPRDESNNNEDYVNKSVQDQVRREDEMKRDSSLYSNNSNNTRTLMQHSPLLEPSAIQISISPAHTAEPVLTPSERLKRLDHTIRDGLVEKQKIICDMFRVPVEHFNEIVDIVGQPEAPKDASDIVLSAYAQVQSLTEVLNDYMKITPEQEISAVSTAVCDQCHQQQQKRNSMSILFAAVTNELRSLSPVPSSITSNTTNTGTTVIPNETSTMSASDNSKILTPLQKDPSLDDGIIHEDDDGYCQIDELRLPSVSSTVKLAKMTAEKSIPIGVAAEVIATRSANTPELLKRQSTISTDSIPEESEQELTQNSDHVISASVHLSKGKEEQQQHPTTNNSSSSDSTSEATAGLSDDRSKKNADDSLSSEHIEINDAYDTTVSLNKSTVFASYDSCRQSPKTTLCAPNRLQHVNSLEPSVPCSVLNGFVSALNSQISLLLPKINERDLERERLRRENQHLRELLSAMHERKRVEDEKETPEVTRSADETDVHPTKEPHKSELSSVPE